MNIEIIWFLVPICGLLSQIGGTWAKWVRRYLIPVLMGVMVFMFKGFTWNIFPMVLAQFAVFTLPFTLKGDGIPENPINWLWLPIWGVLLCSPPLILNWHVWPATVILGLFMAVLGALSNVKTVANWFQWKLVEAFEGIFPAIILCLSVSL